MVIASCGIIGRVDAFYGGVQVQDSPEQFAVAKGPRLGDHLNPTERAASKHRAGDARHDMAGDREVVGLEDSADRP